jgi:hypothetical protein
MYSEEWYALNGSAKQKKKAEADRMIREAQEQAVMADQLTFGQDGDGKLDDAELAAGKQAEVSAGYGVAFGPRTCCPFLLPSRG